MSLMWFIFGAFVVVFLITVKTWIARKEIILSKLWLVGIIFSTMLLFFAIAWCMTSIIEGENRAAAMGFLFFGAPALTVFGLAGKKLSKGITARPSTKKVALPTDYRFVL
ncbi:MAG: hypothetical protein JXD19_02600 [Deltaproteobacteria bacterium]|nr:hypothetical protein [Deltaproteobacteria bacterium]